MCYHISMNEKPTGELKPSRNFFTPLVERVKSILKVPQKAVESAQIGNFQEILTAITKYGGLEAAQKAEPKLFQTADGLSMLSGRPGKAPTQE